MKIKLWVREERKDKDMPGVTMTRTFGRRQVQLFVDVQKRPEGRDSERAGT